MSGDGDAEDERRAERDDRIAKWPHRQPRFRKGNGEAELVSATGEWAVPVILVGRARGQVKKGRAKPVRGGRAREGRRNGRRDVD